MNDDESQKDLINFAFKEFTLALNEARNGRTPNKSYDKLKQIYDTLSAAEKQREVKEITDEEMQNIMAKEVEKLKGDI